MSNGLPSPTQPEPGSGGAWADRIVPIIRIAHGVWAQPQERRRLRAYGFRPAVEEGILKREWHGLSVRIGAEGIRATHAEYGDLAYAAADETLTFAGRPFDGGPQALQTADLLISLINDYERWVEVREGRASRLRRSQSVSSDPRPVNAIAETRRLQRMLGSAWGRPPTRRR